MKILSALLLITGLSLSAQAPAPTPVVKKAPVVKPVVKKKPVVKPVVRPVVKKKHTPVVAPKK